MLTASPGHYVHTRNGLIKASDIRVGDVMYAGEHVLRERTVKSISEVEVQGLYNPQTLHGDILVDGVQASTYTTAVPPQAAHVLLAPLRAVYRLLTWATSDDVLLWT